MAMRAVAAVAAIAGTFVAPVAKPPMVPSLTVAPQSVERGRVVLVRGSAGDCPTGDAVTILSRAFAHAHDFAGVPAVFARVQPTGLYRVSTRIPATRAAGTYTVTARCGGGNLGVLKRLHVRR
jgi:hypothetical protein